MAVLKMNILSKYLGMQTNITVCLPSFRTQDLGDNRLDFYAPGMKFQALYLLHGGSGDDSDYLHKSSIVRYADDNRIAVVMPCGYNHFYADSPNGPRYWRYVSAELPQICQTLFPLSDKREDNFVAGLSMGGYGAMKMGIMNCEEYAAVLCMSGVASDPDRIREWPRPRTCRPDFNDPDLPRIQVESIFGDLDYYKGSIHDLYHRAALNVKQGKKLPKFFMTVGDQDFARPHVEDAYQYFTSQGYDTFFELVPGYGHEWLFWDLTLKNALDNWLPIKHDVLYPQP
jgi:S-formylglutathione hydrolase FrmB